MYRYGAMKIQRTQPGMFFQMYRTGRWHIRRHGYRCAIHIEGQGLQHFVFILGVTAAYKPHARKLCHAAVVTPPFIKTEPDTFVIDTVEGPERTAFETYG